MAEVAFDINRQRNGGIAYQWKEGGRGSYGQSVSRTHADLTDMNGDGLPDLVWTDNDGNIHVRYNQMGKRNLLRTITNPTGQQFHLHYTLSEPNTEQRSRQWLLTQVDDVIAYTDALSCDTVTRRFAYADPHYDAAERTPLGYGVVETHDINTKEQPHSLYRRHIRHYQNSDFVEHGKLLYDALTDAQGNRYTEYKLDILYHDSTGVTDNLCQDITIRVGKESHITTYFEGGQDSIVTAKQYDYDRYHNVVTYRNLGDTHISDDDLSTTITYRDATSGDNLTNNLVSLPIQMSVSSGNRSLWQATATYNAEGRLTAYTQSADDEVRTTDYTYNQYGMVEDITLPGNINEQRVSYAVLYDDYSQSLPATVTNQWGHTTSTEYHPYWQLPIEVTDVAGETIEYGYDNMGCLTSIAAPKERAQNRHTIWYEYHRNYGLDYCRSIGERGTRPSYIDVYTYSDDEYVFGTFHRTFSDARGDMVHRIDMRGVRDIVSNRAERDCFGRSIATYANVWVDDLPQTYYADNLNLIAQTDYDVMDRPTATYWADGNISEIRYGVGSDDFNDKRLTTERVDENGLSWLRYTSPQGWLTTSIAPDGATTSFRYDALGQLLQSTDPDGLITTQTYDGFGRRTERTHPDAGTTIWTYDAADNLITSATQAQLDNGENTTYEYDYNHLTAVHYPRYPQYDTYYEYYPEHGRLMYVSDITGYEYLAYDAMGNVSVSDKTIVVPTENQAYRFMTEFEYDSFGRMRRITYPDGENVTYNYDWGLLYSVKNEDQQTSYIQHIFHDEYGRPIETKYGNNFVATSEYDDVRHWAVRRELQDANNTPLQQTDYEYDGVGNITRVAQSAPTYGNNLGGEYVVDYTYDDQYRLMDAWQYNSVLGDYSYSMDYSLSGLVGYKNSPELDADMVFGYRYEGEFPFSHQPKMIYSPSYYEDMTLLGWDANGQMTTMLQPYQDRFRKHLWDEAGQLVAAIGNEYCGYYGYNANGERVYKLTGSVYADQYNAGDVNMDTYFDDMVLYVNPYMVVTSRGYTKHYYNGSQRIAARLGDYWMDGGTMVDESGMISQAREVLEDRMNINDVEENLLGGEWCRSIYGEEFSPEPYILRINYMNCTYNEDMLYDVFNGSMRHADNMGGIAQSIFYNHTDHLGSASWITDDQGEAVQYVHYMPYGELWVNQQSNSYDERFKFAGKERDTETGYDYFGARFYSPILLLWLSPDPLANKYPNISPYAYCAWNPIKFIDPDGNRIVVGSWFGRVLAKLGINNFEAKAMSQLQELKDMDPELNKMIIKIEKSSTEYHIMAVDGDGFSYNNSKKEIRYNPDSQETKSGKKRPAQVGLAHELGHAENDVDGTTVKYSEKEAKKGDLKELDKWNRNEINSIDKENIVRKEYNCEERPYNYFTKEDY